MFARYVIAMQEYFFFQDLQPGLSLMQSTDLLQDIIHLSSMQEFGSKLICRRLLAIMQLYLFYLKQIE